LAIIRKPTTWRNIPGDTILHSHRRENLKSYNRNSFGEELRDHNYWQALTNNETDGHNYNYNVTYLLQFRFTVTTVSMTDCFQRDIITYLQYEDLSPADESVWSHIVCAIVNPDWRNSV
jgi:hypothetical protein